MAGPATLAVGALLGAFERDAAKLAGALLALLLIPALLLVVAAGALVAVLLGRELPAREGGGTAIAAVPPDQLVVMRRVSAESGVPWELLAAIASVESDFGRNMATSSAGAIGYGQFLPESWAAFGNGGDPYDYRDALPAMARYLSAHGAPGDIPRAVYAYNHSWSYVALVLGRAASYAALGTPAMSTRDPRHERSGAVINAGTAAARAPACFTGVQTANAPGVGALSRES